MEARDLMIGDKLKTVFNQKIVKVKEIKQSCIYTEDNGYDYDEIESIPLTPEILEKNEFEKTLDEDNTECYRYYSSAADGYIKITLWDGGDNDWSLEVVNYEKFDDNEIVYKNDFTFLKVHQLQHVLRVCNIDKDFKI